MPKIEAEQRWQGGSVFVCTGRTIDGSREGEVAKKDGCQIGGDGEGERRCDCARVIAPWSFVTRLIPRATIVVSRRNYSDSGNQWCSAAGNAHSPGCCGRRRWRGDGVVVRSKLNELDDEHNHDNRGKERGQRVLGMQGVLELGAHGDGDQGQTACTPVQVYRDNVVVGVGGAHGLVVSSRPCFACRLVAVWDARAR
jgi:hypothetical protein